MAKDSDIALKSWEVYQNLAKEMGENCWKVRAIYITTISALIAYSYSSNTTLLYLFVSALAPIFFLVESGYRRLQMQYFQKSAEIEITLNDLIAKEAEPRFPSLGVGTDLDTPDLLGLKEMLRLRRIMVWLPYFTFFLFPLGLWILGISNE